MSPGALFDGKKVTIRQPNDKNSAKDISLPEAIRGGVPVVFPQFGQPDKVLWWLTCRFLQTAVTLKAMAQHGFARTSFWSVASIEVSLRVCGVPITIQTRSLMFISLQDSPEAAGSLCLMQSSLALQCYPCRTKSTVVLALADSEAVR